MREPDGNVESVPHGISTKAFWVSYQLAADQSVLAGLLGDTCLLACACLALPCPASNLSPRHPSV